MKTIKQNWGFFVAIFLFILVLSILIFGTKEVRITGKCVDKYVTWTKFGTPHYYVIYRSDDGDVLQSDCSANEYYTRTIGATYYWTERELK